jgi:hypothetical protein
MKNNNKNKKSDNYETRPNIIACRLSIKEYEEFQIWKHGSNSNNNSIAIRKALSVAMNKGG